jgi:hypothetical protein
VRTTPAAPAGYGEFAIQRSAEVSR